MNLHEKITKLTNEADANLLYQGLLEIFNNIGDTQKSNRDRNKQVQSVYCIDECCLPLLSFLGLILNNLIIDQVIFNNLVAKIEILEDQIFETEFSDKNRCLCKIKEIRDAFDSPNHEFRKLQKVA